MIASALVLFALAAAASWSAGRHETWPRLYAAATPLAWLANLAGSVCLVVAGGRGVAGRAETLRLGHLGGLGPAALHVDPLSGLFLLIAFGVAVPAVCAAAAPANQPRGRLPAVVAAVLGAIEVIVTADNLFVLLFGWEALTLAFYLLAGYDRDRAGRASASVFTVGFGKTSGAALLLGGLMLCARTQSFSLDAIHIDPHSAIGQAAYTLLLFGFAVKVGVVPMHGWLPRGYTAAPGPARAVMAGAAVNVGFYGMWRTLDILGPPPIWLACVVLVVAGVTAIVGIAQAAVHPDLATLIAWSSVENAGIITAGFGAALVGAAAGNPELTAAGLIAGTTQVVAHALGKTLLFTATSTIEHTTGTTDLDRLGGVIRRLPWAGTGLVIGSLTLAGLPLTAGFASEWFTLESLMQQFRVSNLAMQLCTAIAGALIALTIGVAGVTFVRIVALTAFGPARIDEPTFDPERSRVERNSPFRLAVAVLVVGCLGTAALAPLEVRVIARGLTPLVGRHGFGGLKGPWVLQPVFADFSALSPTWLWIAIPALSAIVTAVTVVFSGRRMLQVRRVSPWSSASPGVHRGVGYTSFGYANPMRNVLSNLLRTRSELRNEKAEQPTEADTLAYRVDVVDVFERFFYRPCVGAVFVVVRVAKRLQSGRLDAYMAYMLIATLAVLAVVIAAS